MTSRKSDYYLNLVDSLSPEESEGFFDTYTTLLRSDPNVLFSGMITTDESKKMNRYAHIAVFSDRSSLLIEPEETPSGELGTNLKSGDLDEEGLETARTLVRITYTESVPDDHPFYALKEAVHAAPIQPGWSIVQHFLSRFDLDVSRAEHVISPDRSLFVIVVILNDGITFIHRSLPNGSLETSIWRLFPQEQEDILQLLDLYRRLEGLQADEEALSPSKESPK